MVVGIGLALKMPVDMVSSGLEEEPKESIVLFLHGDATLFLGESLFVKTNRLTIFAIILLVAIQNIFNLSQVE